MFEWFNIVPQLKVYVAWGKLCVLVWWKFSVEKRWSAASLSIFWNPHGAMWGDSWTHVAWRPTCLLANFRLPSTDTWGRFNICWAKSRTPVFLFLLSSRPEPPCRSHPALFPPDTSLFVLLLAARKSISAAVCLAPCFPRPPITQLGIYSGTNQSSCFEADPEGCGFYPWLVIVAVSSGPKWVDAKPHADITRLFTHLHNTLVTLSEWMH